VIQAAEMMETLLSRIPARAIDANGSQHREVNLSALDLRVKQLEMVIEGLFDIGLKDERAQELGRG
jgi:hypothetical protein